MQKYFFIISAIFIVGIAQAQNNFKAVIKDEQTKERLPLLTKYRTTMVDFQ